MKLCCVLEGTGKGSGLMGVGRYSSIGNMVLGIWVFRGG